MNLSSFGRRLLQAVDAATFGTVLGLGTAAYKNTGTSGNTVPLLDAANTFSLQQNIGANVASGEANRTLNLIDTQSVVRVWRYTALNVAGPAVELIHGTGATAANAANTWWDFGAIDNGTASQSTFIIRNRNGGGTTSVFVTFDLATSMTTFNIGSISRGAPVTKTADFTVGVSENNLINNKSGSSCTVTLPAASSFTGREILIKNSQAQTVVSASSNVVPLITAAAGTAILASGSGKWAKLVSDGTNWVIMAAA